MIRIQLDITEGVHSNLQEVMKKSGAKSMAEVFRRSLALFHFMVDMQAVGNTVLLQKKGSKETQIVHLL